MSKWITTPLGDIFEIARGGSPRPIQNFLTDDPNGLNWIMIGDTVDGSKYIMATKKRIRPEGLKKSRMVHEGDFLLTNSMSFGRPYILKTSGCIHDGWLVLSPRDHNVHSDFFYYLLGSGTLYREFSRRAAGAVVKNLNTALVRSVEIPFPPLAEQKRIAAILDAADALRTKRRQTLAQLDTLLESTFLDMFGDPVTNPKGWESTKILGELADIVSGITKGRKVKNDRLRDVPYLAVVNVQDRHLKFDVLKTIAATEAEIEKYALKSNDLLLTEGGDPDKLGRGSLWGNELPECIHQNHIFRVRLTSKAVEPVYLNWIIGSARGKQYFLRSAKQTTGIASINMTQLRAFPMLIPPLDLQRRFATIVESVEKQKTRLRTHLAELDTLFASLQSRAFNGEL